MKIGQLIKTKKTLGSGKVLTIHGIVYGKVPCQGGAKWLIKECKIVDPELLTVRKIEKI